MTKNKKSEEMYDKIFEDIDENMEMDIYYSWDQVAKEFFHIRVYSKNSNIKDRSYYIQNRQLYFKAINQRSFKYDKEWKLFIAKHSTHIVKVSKDFITQREIDARMKRMFESMNLTIKYSEWLIENEHIDTKMKKLLRPFISGTYGLETILIGQIQGSKELKKLEKQKLISYAKFPKDEE
jgi:hypothetical protein